MKKKKKILVKRGRAADVAIQRRWLWWHSMKMSDGKTNGRWWAAIFGISRISRGICLHNDLI